MFVTKDTRNHSKESIAERRYHRIKGESLKKILVDRFLNHYGYDKGAELLMPLLMIYLLLLIVIIVILITLLLNCS
jgi:hypothetical protein